MPRRRYARIAITLPMQDLAAADRIAREQDRPRSWIIAEALRQYASALSAGGGRSAGRAMQAPSVVAERPGLGASRRAQLAADLRLTPEERVRAAEETARTSPRRTRGAARRVIVFDRFEDYLDWKHIEDVLG